eukprot:983088-Ditylum_brightwellii.AAC.1
MDIHSCDPKKQCMIFLMLAQIAMILNGMIEKIGLEEGTKQYHEPKRFPPGIGHEYGPGYEM